MELVVLEMLTTALPCLTVGQVPGTDGNWKARDSLLLLYSDCIVNVNSTRSVSYTHLTLPTKA